MKRHSARTLVFTLAMFMATPAALYAQPVPDLDDLTARQQGILVEHLDNGRTLYESGQFADALEAFQAAYEIFPHPDVLYRVAECQEKLGEDADAIANYRTFLAQSPDAPERKRIEGVIDVLERRLAKRQEARIIVRSEPAGARAFLGKVDLGPTPVEIPVTPGTYEVRVERKGYRTVQESVEIAPGRAVELRYTLVSSEGVAPGPGPVVVDPGGPSPVDEVVSNPLTPWVVGGAGAISLIGSIAFWSAYGGAAGQVDAYDAERRDRTRPGDYDELVNARNAYGTGGIVTTTLGLALLGGGVALYVLQENQPPEPDEDTGEVPPSTVLTPVVSPDGAGVQVLVTF